MCIIHESTVLSITLLSQVLKLLERVLDAMIRRRVEGDIGENSKGSGRGEEQQTDVRPETDGTEYTGGTGLWGLSIWRKLLTQYPERW